MGFQLEHSTKEKAGSASGKNITDLLQTEISLFGSFFGNRKKEDFYTELGVLLKAGISLKDGLALIGENQKKEKLSTFYSEMVDALVSGESFADVLQKEKVFTEYEYYSVKIGEETGTLAKVAEELGQYFARKNEQRRALTNALTYPVIILVTAILVVIFMLRMVVPMFQDIFRQNGVELPAITKMIIAASDFSLDYGSVILLGILVLIVFRKTLSRKQWFKSRKDHLLLKLPYVGNFLKAIYLSRFTHAVSLLTASKVPVLNSIRIVKKMIDFIPLQEALNRVEEGVMRGQSLHEAMNGNRIFDNKMISLVKVAEETNQSEYIFERLNHQYSLEVQQKSKLLSTVMEPLIIVIVGFFVGVILVSMYLPMFRLSSVLGG